MENDGMENEEKKQGKHIYAIRLSITCQNQKKKQKLKLGKLKPTQKVTFFEQEYDFIKLVPFLIPG